MATDNITKLDVSTDEDMEQLGHLFRDIRQVTGRPARWAAKQLSMSEETYRNIENGAATPNQESVIEFLDANDVRWELQEDDTLHFWFKSQEYVTQLEEGEGDDSITVGSDSSPSNYDWSFSDEQLFTLVSIGRELLEDSTMDERSYAISEYLLSTAQISPNKELCRLFAVAMGAVPEFTDSQGQQTQGGTYVIVFDRDKVVDVLGPLSESEASSKVEEHKGGDKNVSATTFTKQKDSQQS